jgi:anti-sigma regulatory factor (Ser/Thr protein kinase)
MPSDIHRLDEFVKITLAGLLAETPLNELAIRDVRQAVMEMGGNAIEWGHRKDPRLLVRITYRVGPDAVTINVKDQGPGFDHGQGGGPAGDRRAFENPPADCRHWGFGIMLARGLVDEFSYNERGNEVTLVKRFQGDHGRDSDQR